MILGIDTSLGTAVGVVDESGTVRADVQSADPRGHAEVIGDLITRALAAADVAPTDITHVAVGIGPGPFTGLRVGIAAARAFALGRGIPVVSVPSHDAAALAVDANGIFAVVTDARRREEAVTVYAGGAAPRKIDGPTLKARGTEVEIDELVLAEESSDGSSAGVRRVDVTAISGADIARVASRRLREGTAEERPVEPLYLRAPDVTLSAGPKRVGT